jgi:acid phosphatase family membrane protein YuiD
MKWFIDLITNPYLITGISSWFFAQVIKTILFWKINKKLDWGRMFGDGGMPSGHSATVTSVAVLVGLVCGPGSVEFAISFILAIIVCHDATGVRRETEKQAFIITELVKAFEELGEDKLPEVKLKKFVGHTPVQVTAGILLGIINAIIMYFVMF